MCAIEGHSICANVRLYLFSQVLRLYEIRIAETTQRMWITTDTWRPPDPVISFLITANKEWLQYFLWQKKHQLSSAPLLAYLQLGPNWLESHSNLSRTYWKCAETICLTSALPHCSDNSFFKKKTNVTRNSLMHNHIHVPICWLCSAFANIWARGLLAILRRQMMICNPLCGVKYISFIGARAT